MILNVMITMNFYCFTNKKTFFRVSKHVVFSASLSQHSIYYIRYLFKSNKIKKQDIKNTKSAKTTADFFFISNK